MNIDNISQLIDSRAGSFTDNIFSEIKNINAAEMSPKMQELKDACTQFESVLTEKIMKEGLEAAKAINEDETEQDNGCQAFKDLANEQLAKCIGQTGVMGLADHIFASVKDRIKEEDAK